MRTASELLGSDRDALVPLSATLVARPVRLCVFVPLHSEVAWETSVEHALACQARYWGGHASLVVPRATRTSWLKEPEPVFRYELAEVIYQFLDNDGDVPLLAAYDYFVSMLGARDRRPLDLSFEIEVVSPDGTQSEHDIVAVWGSDLWLGEATKNPNLGPGEVGRLRRLKEVADLVAARGLLFATSGEFSVRTRERVSSVFTAWPQPEVAFVERVPIRPA